MLYAKRDSSREGVGAGGVRFEQAMDGLRPRIGAGCEA